MCLDVSQVVPYRFWKRSKHYKCVAGHKNRTPSILPGRHCLWAPENLEIDQKTKNLHFPNENSEFHENCTIFTRVTRGGAAGRRLFSSTLWAEITSRSTDPNPILLRLALDFRLDCGSLILAQSMIPWQNRDAPGFRVPARVLPNHFRAQKSIPTTPSTAFCSTPLWFSALVTYSYLFLLITDMARFS